MGCSDSKTCSDSIILNQDQFQKRLKEINYIEKEKMQCNNSTPTQNLYISDYEAFQQRSKEEGRAEYPSTFSLIKILPLPDDLLQRVSKQSVSPLNCTRKQLIDLSCSMIMENNFAKSNLKPDDVRLLLTQIAHNYNSVSYHNLSHGVSLMQMLYKCFRLDEQLAKVYSDEELTYCLIAGIAHDVNHPGTNNMFEVNMKSELAKTANNDAVLERMHLHTFLTISKSRPELDVIGRSSNPQKTKELVTRAILATDMAKHFKNLEKIQRNRLQGTLNLKDDQLKIQMMENLIHACDIGNSLLPNEQYLTWGALLSYQFNEQTKLQAKNKIAVTEFLRHKDIVGFYDDQIGFLSKFVIPLWKQINFSFPSIKTMVECAQRNLQKVKELKSIKQK